MNHPRNLHAGFRRRRHAAIAIVGATVAAGAIGIATGASAGTGTPTWLLTNTNGVSTASITFQYGNNGDVPLAGDWDGNRTVTPGVKRGNTYYLSNTLGGDASVVFSFGNADDTPVVGDWDGNGTDTIGVKRGNVYYLTNTHSASVAAQFAFGNADAVPVVGDWDGDGTDTIGVKQGNVYSLTNTLSDRVAVQFAFGNQDDTPVAGDWDGNGIDTVGVKRGNVYYLTNTHSAVVAQQFAYGDNDFTPVVGDWDGDRRDTVGVVRAEVPAPVLSGRQALAQSLLSNGRVAKTGRAVLEDLQQAAAGQPSWGSNYLSTTILRELVEIAKTHTYSISSLTGNGSGHSSGSRHYVGAAVDINIIDGSHLTGRDVRSLAVINAIKGDLPSGSGLGQKGCAGSEPSLPSGVASFADSCDHLHLQVPAGS